MSRSRLGFLLTRPSGSWTAGGCGLPCPGSLPAAVWTGLLPSKLLPSSSGCLELTCPSPLGSQNLESLQPPHPLSLGLTGGAAAPGWGDRVGAPRVCPQVCSAPLVGCKVCPTVSQWPAEG